jgi:hypothetical protein
MSNAAARVLELFLQTTSQGVTGVTHVTAYSVTSTSRAVTTVTPVTYAKPSVDRNGSGSGSCTAPAHDVGATRGWAAALARLDSARPPHDVPPHRWRRFIEDCGRFLDQGCGSCAGALGWGLFDLFGCDRKRPFTRISDAGLLWLLNGRKLVALTADTATIETLTGAHQTYRRRRVATGQVVLPWELNP